MNENEQYPNLDDVAEGLDQREPVFVDEDGMLHDARTAEDQEREHSDQTSTRLKDPTWSVAH